MQGLSTERSCIGYNGGNMASKANHQATPQRTALTWLLCYIACYAIGFFTKLLKLIIWD
jgi:hypothetical protein